MTDWRLGLYRDRVDAETAQVCESRERVLYCVSGRATIDAEGTRMAIGSGEAWSGPGPIEMATGPEPATLLRWELDDLSNLDQRQPAPSYTTQLLVTPITLPDAQCLMRCDRVEFPPGAVAYTHTHRGPGIRCLLQGQITVTAKGERKTLGPMEPWFETGVDPVFAAASETEVTAFVRVMVLPASIQGQSSIRYVNDEDRAKPKPQKYMVFVDRPLTSSADPQASQET